MASGTPVVASKIAVEGLNITDGVHLLTSNKATDLADLTVRVLNDKNLWQQLSKNGKEFVAKNYDWELISQKLDRIYQEIGNYAKK
jgi:glycosyltransferase involved in cell wall biosynthesis